MPKRDRLPPLPIGAATQNGTAFTASCAAGHHRIPHNERMS
ncbi:hypothetical protein MPS_1744 [Mycobacterium pseudoshottsii JCM 15466]|nr:hypothetical protein MPS_1744 [Mycobacterium pseudoshottsii JCM 15466]